MAGYGSQPAPQGGGQKLAFAGEGMDAEVAGQPGGHHLLVAVETIVHLKAGGIRLPTTQANEKDVTVAHGSAILGLAVNDGQRPMGIGEDVSNGHAKGGQGFFIGLMAPAQQVVKMHDACRISFPETNGATDHQPWGRSCRHWVGRGGREGEGGIRLSGDDCWATAALHLTESRQLSAVAQEALPLLRRQGQMKAA